MRYKNDIIQIVLAHARSIVPTFLFSLVLVFANAANAQQSPLPPGTTAGSTGGTTIPGLTTGGSTGGVDPQSCGTNTGDMCALPSSGADDVASANNNASPMSHVGNPVSLITGNKYQLESDYQSTASKLQFNRHYNSHNSDFNFGFGRGWTSTYSTKLSRVVDEGFDILQGTGQKIQFRYSDVDDSGRTIYRADSPAMGFIFAEESNKHRWVLPDGRILLFQGSYLVEIDFPGASLLTLFYRDGRLSEVKDEAGRLLLLEYYPADGGLSEYSESGHGTHPNHLSRLILPDGNTVEYDYDDYKNLSRARYSDGTSREFHFEDSVNPNNLTGITDRTGVRYATWSYYEDGKAASSEHANGVERVSIDYYPPEHEGDIGTTSVTNSLGEVSDYTWQSLSHLGQTLLLSSDGPGCSTCPKSGMRYSYNERYQVETVAHESGEQVRFVYDEIGRISDVYKVQPGSDEVHRLQYQYAGNSSFATMVSNPSVNPDERHEVFIEYTDEKLPSRITEKGYVPTSNDQSDFSPIERSTTLAYENGRLSAIDGPRTDVEDITRFNYDQLGRLIRVDMPTGQTMLLDHYDEHGRATSFRTGSQAPLNFKYDENGRVVEISQLGQTIHYQYDGEGRLTGLVDPNGKAITVAYDEAGRLSRFVDDMGLVTDFVSDSEGRITDKSYYGLSGELIRSLSYVFDAQSRLQSINEHSIDNTDGNPKNRQTDLQYNDLDQLVSRSNPSNGSSTDIAYDAFGRLSTIGDGIQALARIDYDNKGQDIGLTDSNFNSTRFLKDDFGRIVTLISPDSGTTHYRYDESGNRIQKMDGEGNQFSYQWDAGDRLIREQNADGATTYRYHPTNGRLIETTNPVTTEYFTYSDQDQLVKHTRELDGNILHTAFVYNEHGKLARKILPDGQILRYHYHEVGVNIGSLRAITRETLLGLSQETLVGEIDSERRDGATGYLAHNGTRTTTQYSADGELRSIDVSNTLQLQYRFDDDGNIVGINVDNNPQSYFYSDGNLIQASTALGEFQYQYDSSSNRVSSSAQLSDGTEQETYYEYGADGQGNRLRSTTNVVDNVTDTYQYNPAGSPLAVGDGYSYTYNANQRPIAVYKNGVLLAEYRYNSFGERVKKVVYGESATNTTYYLYDGKNLTAEVSAFGALETQYVYLYDNRPVVKLDNKQTYAIHTDNLGTPRRLTDDNNQLVWDADYEPFGKASVFIETVSMNLRLPGQYLDAETDTHYNYFRNYDPATGRYITSDPIGLQGGMNTYAYAENLPLSLTDRLGLATDPTASTPVLVKPTSDSFESKLESVFNYTLAKLEDGAAKAVFEKAFEDFKQTALVMGGLAAVLGVALGGAAAATGGAAIPVAAAGLASAAAAIGARALWITGFQGVAFIYKLISIGLDIYGAKHDDCSTLTKIGDDLHKLVIDTGAEVVQTVVTFGLGKIVNKLSNAFKLSKTTGSVRGICSFHGDTLVLTRNGKKPIKDIRSDQDEVYAQDASTGKKGWKKVLAAYSNRYQSQVHVTAVNAKGARQKITSNRIHPYFTRLAAASLLTVSTASYSINSEGHDYNGPIEGGQWVDAQYLQAGSELLSQNNEWLTVAHVEQEQTAFDAYNLTVAEYSTYYVSGRASADSIWVHNKCWDSRPDGYEFTGPVVYGKQTYVNGTGQRIYRAFDKEKGRYRWFSQSDHPIQNSMFGGRGTSNSANQSGLNQKMSSNAFNLKPETGGPYQAHHIMTWENWKNPGPVKDMLARIKFNMNHPDNGIYLPKDSCGTGHNGCHPGYSDAIKGFLERLEQSGKSDDEISEIIYKGITKARENFGLPDTGVGGVSLKDGAAWEKIMRAVF